MKSIEEIVLVNAMIKMCILSILVFLIYCSYTIIKVKLNRKREYKKSLLKKQALAVINKNRLREEHRKMLLVIKDF